MLGSGLGLGLGSGSGSGLGLGPEVASTKFISVGFVSGVVLVLVLLVVLCQC